MADAAVAAQPWVPEDTFATRLIQIRRHLDLTQAQAAGLCGLKPATWNTWENGSRPQAMNEVVRKIHKGLGVDPGWLMWGAQSRAALSEKSQRASDLGLSVVNGPKRLLRSAKNRTPMLNVPALT